MSSFRFRPSLERAEDRLTPAVTPLDVANAVNQIKYDAGLLDNIVNSGSFRNPAAQPQVQAFLQYIATNDAQAGAVLAEFNAALAANPAATAATRSQYLGYQAQANFHEAITRQFAAALGIPVGGSPAAASTAPTPNANSAVGTGTITMPAYNGTDMVTGQSGGSSGTGSDPSTGGSTIDLTSDSGMTNTKPDTTGSDFTDLGDGVRIKDIQVGTGATATSTSNVTLYYTGWRNSDGVVFDSRRSPSNPATFDLQNTIVGFYEGISNQNASGTTLNPLLAGMKVGGIRQIYIPSAKGYGANGFSPNIPPNENLVFEVKLISVNS